MTCLNIPISDQMEFRQRLEGIGGTIRDIKTHNRDKHVFRLNTSPEESTQRNQHRTKDKGKILEIKRLSFPQREQKREILEDILW